jgi:hypothetical protein
MNGFYLVRADDELRLQKTKILSLGSGGRVNVAKVLEKPTIEKP